MAQYTLVLIPDENGIGKQLQIDAPNAWVAINRVRDRIGLFGAEIYEGKKFLGRVTKQIAQNRGFWEIAPHTAD